MFSRTGLSADGSRMRSAGACTLPFRRWWLRLMRAIGRCCCCCCASFTATAPPSPSSASPASPAAEKDTLPFFLLGLRPGAAAAAAATAGAGRCGPTAAAVGGSAAAAENLAASSFRRRSPAATGHCAMVRKGGSEGSCVRSQQDAEQKHSDESSSCFRATAAACGRLPSPRHAPSLRLGSPSPKGLSPSFSWIVSIIGRQQRARALMNQSATCVTVRRDSRARRSFSSLVGKGPCGWLSLGRKCS